MGFRRTGKLLFNSTSDHCRLGYSRVWIRDPPFLQWDKEPLLRVYVTIKQLLRILLRFMDYVLIPPSPHPEFYSIYFLAMNPQVFHNSHHQRTQQKNPACFHYQYQRWFNYQFQLHNQHQYQHLLLYCLQPSHWLHIWHLLHDLADHHVWPVEAHGLAPPPVGTV